MGGAPSGPAGRRGERGRTDRPPGWADSLLAGRSRADKEAEQDAQLRVMLLVGAVLGTVALALDAVFTGSACSSGGGRRPCSPRCLSGFWLVRRVTVCCARSSLTSCPGANVRSEERRAG